MLEPLPVTMPLKYKINMLTTLVGYEPRLNDTIFFYSCLFKKNSSQQPHINVCFVIVIVYVFCQSFCVFTMIFIF